MTASQSPRQAGEGTALPGGGSTPVPAEVWEPPAGTGRNLPRAGEGEPDRCVSLPAGAQTSGPCPHCGHYGPRIVLCHNPDCLHSESMHDLKRNGSRGVCSVSTGRKATKCTCTAYVPNPETSS